LRSQRKRGLVFAAIFIAIIMGSYAATIAYENYVEQQRVEQVISILEAEGVWPQSAKYSKYSVISCELFVSADVDSLPTTGGQWRYETVEVNYTFNEYGPSMVLTYSYLGGLESHTYTYTNVYVHQTVSNKTAAVASLTATVTVIRNPEYYEEVLLVATNNATSIGRGFQDNPVVGYYGYNPDWQSLSSNPGLSSSPYGAWLPLDTPTGHHLRWQIYLFLVTYNY
jgi:hypothetical protein